MTIISPRVDISIKNFIQTGDLPSNYIYHRNYYNYPEMTFYVVAAILLHPNFNFEIQDNKQLYSLFKTTFLYDFGIYKRVINKLSFNKFVEVVRNNQSEFSFDELPDPDDEFYGDYLGNEMSFRNMALDLFQHFGLI